MGASALFLSVWVTYHRPVHALRETFGFRKAYAGEANALAETALVASEARERRLRRSAADQAVGRGWQPDRRQAAKPAA